VTTDIEASDGAPAQTERFRPRYHYTPRRNWMSDPNGLVYFAGEYHLFYQYNPHGLDWGHMSWGHAVSSDLLSWHELPVAIAEGDGMIFSGSAIVDHGNVSGLGHGDGPPILAYYTEHLPDPGRRERQSLAYSNDRARTFDVWAKNPIIDIGSAHFRDPKVLYHPQTDMWILIVALTHEHCIRFYRSKDLLNWHHASTFGPVGAIAGQWECADLFLCPTDDGCAEYWVLKVDLDEGMIDGGSGSQYFVGHFDGTTFRVDEARGQYAGLPLDYGPDFYAAASWSSLPGGVDSPIIIAWMSNQQSGHHYPTTPWRGTMSLPRSLYLFQEEGMLRLGQRPVNALNALRGPATSIAPETLQEGQRSTLSTRLECSMIEAKLLLTDDAMATLRITSGSADLIALTIDAVRQRLDFTRFASPHDQTGTFAYAAHSALPFDREITFQIFFDRSTVEIFVNDGRRVFSACVFPPDDSTLTAECDQGEVRIIEATTTQMMA